MITPSRPYCQSRFQRERRASLDQRPDILEILGNLLAGRCRQELHDALCRQRLDAFFFIGKQEHVAAEQRYLRNESPAANQTCFGN